ncbi:MAG TPA: asparagine synthase (glutamine-hydrolyzing) [Bryobacteraceae bacterium]|nr:asparagine synthase (glutamine-hydrolyzing) [Bryobacteraceae bacterium]
MCGIAGFTHTRRPADASRIWTVTRALTHRGPDKQDVWESAHISLGAVRLRIIDLEHGDQPMFSNVLRPDDGTVLVFNGEVYNHAELRRELEALGHRFETRCDTEVVLHAFLEWDVAAFKRLRGMFGAAFWNESRRRLVLARDRLGIKPLYYSRREGEVYFGSEMKAILLHPEIPRHVNPSALDRYLALNYIPGTETMVAGIEKLAPGCWLEWQDGSVAVERYWELQFHPDARWDLPSATRELDRLLRESVREHLISDAPLGVWSSGGLDSSTILHYAVEESASRLKTFSVSFRGRSFDETPYFREVAKHYGTEHHEFDLNPEADLQSAIEEFATYSDEPSADAGALPVWFLSKMCRRDVTVALSGDGADELFGGYQTYLADRYARRLRALPYGIRAWAARAAHLLPVSDEKIGLDYKITRMLEGSLLDPVDAHMYWNGTFGERARRELLANPEWCAEPLTLPGTGVGCLNQFLWLDQVCYLPDDILNKCDRMSMAHSLEVRPPFLDHRIAEFAARLPEGLKIHGTQLKFVLRELMRGKLPAAVLKRGKEGFDIPAHHWLRTTLRPLLTETLSEKNVRASGLFSWDAVEGIVRSHVERRANFGYHLWGLLVLFLWMKRWQIEPPSPEPGKREPRAASAVTP